MCKKLMALFLVLVLCSGLMIGCGGNSIKNQLKNPPEIEQIMSDIENFSSSVLPENLEINGGEVVRRQSNPDEKEDIVYIRLTGKEKAYMNSQYFVKLLYNFYDEGGWILDEMEVDQPENWGAIGYLDAEGRPLEEGMVYIGRDVVVSESVGSSGASSGGSDGPEAYRYRAPKIGEKDASIVINNQGMWHSYGVVSDMNGNVIEGIVDTSEANRTFAYEDGLVYLCDMEGNKLSSGYLEVSYAGAVKDDNNNIVDHRWRVCIDDKIGFLNDAGEEILKPNAYSIEGNEKASFVNSEGTSGNLCVLKQGPYNCVISNQHGQELKRVEKGSGKILTVTSNGFVIQGNENADGEYEVSAFNSNGTCIVDRQYYYYVSANEKGVALQRSYDEGWDLYDWSGECTKVLDENGDLTDMNKLDGLYYYARYDFDSCLYKLTGMRATPDHVRMTGMFQYYSTYNTLTTFDGDVYSLDGARIISGYERVLPIDGGLYIVTNSEGKDALFDMNGNQRTQFFEDIWTYSENGQYFIVQMDGKLYAMRTPLTETELDDVPAFHAFNCIV